MFQRFLRASSRDRVSDRQRKQPFKARRAERDAETDQARINSIMRALQIALDGAESEQAGLAQRVDDALARAAVTFGNGADEYLEREALDGYHQDLFAEDISNGQRRLNELAQLIKHLKFLKSEMLRRFAQKPP